MLRTLRDALIAVIVERSVNWLAPSLLPYAWLIISSWLTFDVLRTKPLKNLASSAYSKWGKKRPMLSYATVFVFGGMLLCFYWWGINKGLMLARPALPPKTTIEQLSNSELKQRATRVYRKIDDIDRFYDDAIQRGQDRRAKHEITEEQFHEIWIGSLRRGGDEFDKSVRSEAAIVLDELRKRIPPESRKHIVGLPDLVGDNPKDGTVPLYFAVPTMEANYGFTHLLAREIEQLVKLLPDD